ncbi:MAG: agmatinase family protein [Planctomycetes bacterium]|nr:agmatinase family protein [Planctomycetota bacterium]
MSDANVERPGVVRTAPEGLAGAFPWPAASPDPLDELLGSHVSTRAEDVASADAILYGLPFDGAVLGRKGAAAGPRAIRLAARKLKTARLDGRAISARVADLGDAELPLTDVPAAHAGAEKWARRAREHAQRGSGKRPARVIALGGDHSLAFPCVKPYLDSFGAILGVINLDAHLDVRATGEGLPPNSGTGFGRLLDAGLKSYLCVGARDFQTSGAYIDRALKAGARIVPATAVHTQGPARVAEHIFSSLPREVQAIYLSIDLDVADASVAPGVSAPTPGGLFAHQLFELVRLLASDPRVVACDIMELAPMLEPPGTDITCRLAAGCLAELLATTRVQEA